MDLDDVIGVLEFKTRRAEYVLHSLTTNGLLEVVGWDYTGNALWRLSDRGLKYVVEAHLLDE